MRALGKFVIYILIGMLSQNSASLTKEGHRKLPNGQTLVKGSPEWQNQMSQDGLVALYLFNETSGSVLDHSGYLTPMNLTIDNPGSQTEVVRSTSGLSINFPVLIHSGGPATKINNACKASQQLTLEAWLRPRDSAQPNRRTPLSIITLSRKAAENKDSLSSANRNFLLGQHYDEGSRYKAILRTSTLTLNGGDAGPFMQTEARSLVEGELQHVMFTRFRDVAAGGREVSRIYLSYMADDGQTVLDALRFEEFNDVGLRGTFNNWDMNAVLGIGNEISYRDPLAAPIAPGSAFKTEDRAWLGELYLVAVYCKALEPVDFLGSRAPGQASYPRYQLDPNMNVTPNHLKAMQIYRRLVGVTTTLANPVISQMAQEIANGGDLSLMRAAELATRESDFYNITVRDFAARMSTRDEKVTTPLNDFTATVIGVVRDDISAKQLLTGGFVYEGDPVKAAVPSNKVLDILLSNRHYESLEKGRFDLSRVLIQKPQSLYDGSEARPHPEPAGLLTTRSWMSAHAIAGTNRRPVEFTFREFLCIPMEKWADNDASDDYVGRDVDRFPAGNHANYTSTCRACHAVMDGFRGAFAYYNFNNEYTKYTYYFSPGNLVTDLDDETMSTVAITPTLSERVVIKMNHNDQGRGGRVTANNNFVNNARTGANALYFGWGEKSTGVGIKGFGEMISEAKAFPRCMSQRVFRSLCKREPAAIDKGIIDQATTDFIASDYNFKKLFQRIAVSKECIGEN